MYLDQSSMPSSFSFIYLDQCPNLYAFLLLIAIFIGMRKAYWITCNVEPDIQHLSLDRRKLPSSFVVRPRDLNRLLANFQSTLQEITIIATQQSTLPPDAADQIGGKAVELRSYIDPTKGKLGKFVIISLQQGQFTPKLNFNILISENDSSLHTQLWIDPAEEFVLYTHSRDPVDVTFGVKELKVMQQCTSLYILFFTEVS